MLLSTLNVSGKFSFETKSKTIRGKKKSSPNTLAPAWEDLSKAE